MSKDTAFTFSAIIGIWRILLAAAAAAIVTTLYLGWVFGIGWPNTLQLGVPVGQLAGCLIGMVWQVSSVRRPSQLPRGVLLALLGLSGVIATVSLRADFPVLLYDRDQLTVVRTLGYAGLRAILVNNSNGLTAPARDPNLLDSVERLMQAAQPFSVNHEMAVTRFKIIFRGELQDWAYDAWVPARHQDDVALTYYNYGTATGGYRDILIPGLGKLMRWQGLLPLQ